VVNTNNNVPLNFAIGKIKGLGLKSEKKFINKLNFGGIKRKNIITEAERVSEKEREFLSFLDDLNISKTQLNGFISRMDIGDLELLKKQAKLVSNDTSNIKSDKYNRMKSLLETLSLNKNEENSFLERTKSENVNITRLISEAMKLDNEKSQKRTTDKKNEYRKLIMNVKLNDNDKNVLVASITNKSNLNFMRKKAEELVQIRKDEKMDTIQKNLLFFLTPLKINQKNKNDFIKRLENNNANVESIKREAVILQNKTAEQTNETNRTMLKTRLNELGLNNSNKLIIMKQFANGNKNINKLITDAKLLKQTRNNDTLSKQQQEYVTFLTSLSNLTNEDKKELMNNGKLNKQRALELSNKRKKFKKDSDISSLNKILNEIGIVNQEKLILINSFKNDKLTFNGVKNKAYEMKENKNREKRTKNRQTLENILEKTNLSKNQKTILIGKFNSGDKKLDNLRKNINSIVKNLNSQKLSKTIEKFKEYMKDAPLSQQDKNAFITKLTLNANEDLLKRELNNLIKNITSKQRAQNRDEIVEYIKTIGLSDKEKQIIIEKFEANDTILINGIKQEANILLSVSKGEKLNRNVINLEKYMKNLNINNLTKNSFINRLKKEDLEGIKNEAKKFSDKKKSDNKNQKNNFIKAYANDIGLTNNKNQQNIINKNLNINEAKKMANLILKGRIEEKRIKDKNALKLRLSEMGLNNNNKNQFLSNFNLNTPINKILANADVFIRTKGSEIRNKEYDDLLTYMNNKSLTNGEKVVYITEFRNNKAKIENLKARINKYVVNKRSQKRSSERVELINFLKKQKLGDKNITSLVDNFDNTNANVNSLKKRATTLNAKRKAEQFAIDEGEFLNYLDRLTHLTADNKVEITDKLNGYFTNWNTIKRSATNQDQSRLREQQEKLRNELIIEMKKLNFTDEMMKPFLTNFNSNKKSQSTVLSNIKNEKMRRNQQTKNTNRQELLEYLNTLHINQSDVNQALRSFNATSNLNKVKENAKSIETDKLTIRRNTLKQYMNNLEINATEKNNIIKTFNNDPKNEVEIRRRIKQLKNEKNVENRMKLRNELSKYLNTLNMLTNNNKIGILNKNIINLNKNKNTAKQIQEDRKRSKRNSNTQMLQNRIKNMHPENQQFLLNKFKTKNVTIQSVLNNGESMRFKRKQDEKAKNRNELYEFINNLGMNVPDRDSLMNKFNKADISLTNLKNQASELMKKRITNKRISNRNDLNNFLNNINLSGDDKTSILSLFNANNNKTLLSMKAEAENLVMKRKVETRLTNRGELSKYITNLKLNQLDVNSILNKFNSDNTISLANVQNEAARLLNKRIQNKKDENRKSLIDFMLPLNITNVNRNGILKLYDSNSNSIEKLQQKSMNIQNVYKVRKEQKKNLSNYINQLGVNGSTILKKYNNSQTPNVLQLKDEVNKLKLEKNSKLVNIKRKNLRNFFENKRLSIQNKQFFLNKVNVNSNMNIIKKEVKLLNDNIKAKNENFARKKTELTVLLNDLNNLNKNQKNTLLSKVTGPTTNFNALKNEARRLSDSIRKNRENDERRREENRIKAISNKKITNKTRLNVHLNALKHLTNTEMDEYKKNFESGTGNIDQLLISTVQKNKDNEKDKETLREYIRNLSLSQIKKEKYLAAIKVAHVNTKPIRMQINKNVKQNRLNIERFKIEIQSKLKSLKTLTPEERLKFINKMSSVNSKNVLEEAKKLNNSRLQEKANREQKLKNVSSELQSLSDLTRENRKSLMNQLSTNNKNVVIKKARNLNTSRKSDQKKLNIRQEIEFNMKKINGLTNDNISSFMKKWNNSQNKTILENAKKFASTKNIENYIMKANIPNKQKQSYIKQVEQSGANATPIKALVNQDVKMYTLKKQLKVNISKIVTGLTGQYRRGWEGAVNDAQTEPKIKEIEEDLLKKQKLRNRIESSKVGPLKKKGHMSRVMDVKDDVNERMKILEQQLEQKIIEDVIPSKYSAINRLKTLSTNRKTFYKTKIKSAKTINNLNRIQREAEQENTKNVVKPSNIVLNVNNVVKPSNVVLNVKNEKTMMENRKKAQVKQKGILINKQKEAESKRNIKANIAFNLKLAEKRRLLREREAKSEPKIVKTKKR